MLEAVIFDMDGTITRPRLDFRKIRAEIGVPEPLLENLLAMEEGPARRRAWDILERHEREAVALSELNDGAADTLRRVDDIGLRTALVTRNSRASVEGILARHGLRFDAFVSREDAPVKPSPEPLLRICAGLRIEPSRALMVGDFKYDVMSGRAAGTRTCLLTNGSPPRFEVESDYVIEALPDLVPILRAALSA